MAIEVQLHPVQVEILRVLLFKPIARFSELNRMGLSNDHFTFHMKKLLEVGLLEKLGEGSYQLTVSGKEFANRFDTEGIMKIERQAKLGARIGAVRERKGRKEYLLEQRLKQPYFGYWGFVGGKIKWGETVEEGAAREFKEETGLKGTLTLVRIKHKMDYSQDGAFLEDKYFFVFRADNVTGKLLEQYEGGRNQWLSLDEIKALPKLYPDVLDGIEAIEKRKLDFTERKYEVASEEY